LQNLIFLALIWIKVGRTPKLAKLAFKFGSYCELRFAAIAMDQGSAMAEPYIARMLDNDATGLA
jgi:hypothetical protein